jgi:signal transduction histidine kinase
MQCIPHIVTHLDGFYSRQLSLPERSYTGQRRPLAYLFTCCAMFRLFRYFSITSLVSVLLTAAGIATLYRQVTVNSILFLSEQNNIMLAQTALNAIHEELLDYLDSVRDLRSGRASGAPPPTSVQNAVQNLIQDTPIIRIVIYNRHGTVVASTDPARVGSGPGREDGEAFLAAVGGKIVSEFTYRDALAFFTRKSAEDNVVETYLPIRRDRMVPVEGVFEINIDINPLVRDAEKKEVIIMGGGLLLMSLLYGVLLFIVGRAKHTIDSQQQTIRDRTQTLELLSAQMLRKEETEKQKLAADLHEGVAQTLSAIKFNLETSSRETGGESPEVLERVIPAIQSAIQEVRSISTGLRPPSLDDFGILATLSWLCREFEAVYPGIHIDPAFDVDESDIPAPLKIIIYRISRGALNRIATQASTARVRVRLLMENGSVALVIDDQAAALRSTTGNSDADARAQTELATMEERTVLSGGLFSAQRNQWGGMTLRASWMK